MNASHFMDKQILELSGSGAQSSDFLELLSPPENHQSNGAGGVGKKDEILPSYDFQPIRAVGSSSPPVGLDCGRAWGSADSKPGSSGFQARSYGSLEAHDSSKITHEKSREEYDTATLVELDRTVKKYADNLLHALEGVSSRLSQLEGRTHNLESAIDDLKLCIANNNGSTDGKLRQLENILREVQDGVQVIRDKQEIAEAHLQLAKLQASKGEHHQPPDGSSVPPTEPRQPPVAPLQQYLQQPAQPLVAPPPPAPTQLPAPPVPPTPHPQQNPPPVQFPPHVPQMQIPSVPPMPPREPYFPTPGPPMVEAPQQQYQPPPQQPHLPPPQQYQPAAQLSQYSQLPPSSQPLPPLQPHAPLPHHPEEPSPYMAPPQTYPPSIRQPPPPPTGPLPSQQVYGSASIMYEPPAKSGPNYGPPSGSSLSESYPYRGSPSHHSPGMKPSPFSSSTAARLPTAQLLPPAAPTVAGSGGSTGNRVPIDDVVDKVATMGFPRDLVRATVRRLTENGQNVDLNVVLDKLMNDGENQPPKGWLGR